VLLADAHQIVREAVRVLLEREGLHIVAEAGDGREAMKLATALRPDVVLLELSMPLLNGPEAARGIRRAVPGAKVIVVTAHSADPYVRAALRAGIHGYVLKGQPSADLVRAISDVVKGTIYLSPSIAHSVVEAYLARAPLPPDRLSGREREVLQLVAEGHSTKQVAHRLGISVKTADCHRTRIMRKLEVHSTVGLVRHAVRHGVITP
jgi:DNA-binding NarL/FixJ family response regulator